MKKVLFSAAAVLGLLTAAEAGGSGSGTLTGVGVGWFDVYPRFLLEGRLIGEAELREGANVVVFRSSKKEGPDCWQSITRRSIWNPLTA